MLRSRTHAELAHVRESSKDFFFAPYRNETLSLYGGTTAEYAAG